MTLTQFLCRGPSLLKSLTATSLGRILKSPICYWNNYLREVSVLGGKFFSTKIVLGIETSCDDTGAAVVDETGSILGEALHSQTDVHLKTGGIIPAVAQQLHQENIARVVQHAVSASGVSMDDISAIATTVMPGLALSLGIGLKYSLGLVKKHQKPFIPIHHMEAHALTARLTDFVAFPFLVLLLSGGHCILAVAQGVSDFLLLGQTKDIAPGDMLDKVARRLSLHKHPECSGMNGGRAIEILAQQGNILQYKFRIPMQRYRDCTFSFAGLQSEIVRTISKEEAAEGICPRVPNCVCILLHVCFENLCDGNSCRPSGRATSLSSFGPCCSSPVYNDCPHCRANTPGHFLLQRERNHTPRKGNFGMALKSFLQAQVSYIM
ncbi:tRNA N6-adenosine threonylcarbamoyltransferase, mitochondrial isoform 2-T2 [Liasis olivaceus]